ncbi:MAG: ComF family protein [Actinomycetia bacterium]|nr:ComF family protein [Actinomycetes bacterium]MCP4222883.1 ComF family protein [Actinomycetes bacterium]MCP5034817.1 ComF family protein [Actinomycetes bacterium]
MGLDGLGALGSYQAHSRRILLAAKNGGRFDLLRSLGADLADLADLRGTKAAVITWVPASRKMKRRRGYDQGQILARAMARRTGMSARCLLRRDSRQAQAGATRSERLRGPDLIGLGPCPSSVILVDDVCTSGASLAAATTVLRAHGAVDIRASVVAVVPGT